MSWATLARAQQRHKGGMIYVYTFSVRLSPEINDLGNHGDPQVPCGLQ